MPRYQGDSTHYSHHSVFPNVSEGTEALSVLAGAGRNMLSGSKWPGTLLLKDRVESTWETNVHTQVYGHLLIATLGGRSLLPWDTEGPNILMQAVFHPVIPGKPELSLLGCQGAWACPIESSQCLSMMATQGEITMSWKATGSGNGTLVRLEDRGFVLANKYRV